MPLIDFEKDEPWTVEATDGYASVGRSSEEIIWDDFTYKLNYHPNSTEAKFIVRPPSPVKIQETFTAVNLWVFGNYRIWRAMNWERLKESSKEIYILLSHSQMQSAIW